jgi:hypothetical protein
MLQQSTQPSPKIRTRSIDRPNLRFELFSLQLDFAYFPSLRHAPRRKLRVLHLFYFSVCIRCFGKVSYRAVAVQRPEECTYGNKRPMGEAGETRRGDDFKSHDVCAASHAFRT